MKSTLLSFLALITFQVALNAQSEPALSSYMDHNGNWILHVENTGGESLKVRLLDERGGLLAVRKVKADETIVRLKLDLSQTTDSVFRIVLSSRTGVFGEVTLKPEVAESQTERLARLAN